MPVHLNNRDLSTTWLTATGFDPGHYEVNPWELIDNALENAGLPEGIGLAILDIFETMIDIDGTDYKGRTIVEILDEFCAVYQVTVKENPI